ncbi:MAG: hypothetical protein O3C43_17460 [Verrucomicrobia bacterium]|nr:hypothetical protein [Verrucomicrobiota bacterium]MDA1068279.1 hypothetical protein [Verrucomicrobiota bacterium]
MKKLLSIIAVLAFATGLYAEEAKVVTLKGVGTCAKCNLGTADKCTNVLQVTGKNEKVRTYTFAKNVDHADYFCKGETAGLVVKGTVAKVDGKLVLTANSVEKKDS